MNVSADAITHCRCFCCRMLVVKFNVKKGDPVISGPMASQGEVKGADQVDLLPRRYFSFLVSGPFSSFPFFPV